MLDQKNACISSVNYYAKVMLSAFDEVFQKDAIEIAIERYLDDHGLRKIMED